MFENQGQRVETVPELGEETIGTLVGWMAGATVRTPHTSVVGLRPHNCPLRGPPTSAKQHANHLSVPRLGTQGHLILNAALIGWLPCYPWDAQTLK